MIRLWIYGLLIRYYTYCYHSWMDVFCNTREETPLIWAKHYGDKLRKTHMKKEAYKYYISLKKL